MELSKAIEKIKTGAVVMINESDLPEASKQIGCGLRIFSRKEGGKIQVVIPREPTSIKTNP